jgi:hypothetical protein
MAIIRKSNKNKKNIMPPRRKSATRKISKKRYAPELYSGEAPPMVDVDQREIPSQWVAPDFVDPSIMIIDTRGGFHQLKPQVGAMRGWGGERYDPAYDVYTDTINQFMQSQPPNVVSPNDNPYNIPYFNAEYNLPRDIPPSGWKKILQKIKDKRAYNRDASDFAHKHRLMRDSEISDRYWTNDGMFYMDINIYDDMERKRALVKLYEFRRNQSVDKASMTLLKHKHDMHSKKNAGRDLRVPAAKVSHTFDMLIGGYRPTVSEHKTGRGFETIIRGGSREYTSDEYREPYGGVKLKRHSRKSVDVKSLKSQTNRKKSRGSLKRK